MSTDLKTSLLINRQVPEFVREEYPLFIQFLEAYYEFLETEQGTQNNDLTTKAKDLRFISDVDESIDEFQQYFLDNFASLVPQDALVDKSFLVKNVLPLYLSRGSQKSFEFLFRLLTVKKLNLHFQKIIFFVHQMANTSSKTFFVLPIIFTRSILVMVKKLFFFWLSKLILMK